MSKLTPLRFTIFPIANLYRFFYVTELLFRDFFPYEGQIFQEILTRSSTISLEFETRLKKILLYAKFLS